MEYKLVCSCGAYDFRLVEDGFVCEQCKNFISEEEVGKHLLEEDE